MKELGLSMAKDEPSGDEGSPHLTHCFLSKVDIHLLRLGCQAQDVLMVTAVGGESDG